MHVAPSYDTTCGEGVVLEGSGAFGINLEDVQTCIIRPPASFTVTPTSLMNLI
jgi:hypothetical protein